MRPGWICCVLMLLAARAAATDLSLGVESGGSHTVVVGPGALVEWSVVGELSDAANEGLALFLFDVAFDGGALGQAAAPARAPMTSFDRPLGLTNPAGYGGTPSGGALLQVGGAQNTIKNSFAAVPIGAVVPGVAWPGSAELLVSGSLTAPLAPGSYTLSLDNVMANVLREGETGTPFWAVDAAGIGPVSALTVVVEALTSDVASASVAGLGQQTLWLDAGAANAFRPYFILGSFTGEIPGITLGNGLHIALNVDAYFGLLVDLPDLMIAPQIGVLDGDGKASATLSIPPGTPPELVGLTLRHAFVLLDPKDFASDTEPLLLVP